MLRSALRAGAQKIRMQLVFGSDTRFFFGGM